MLDGWIVSITICINEKEKHTTNIILIDIWEFSPIFKKDLMLNADYAMKSMKML